jgi:hypothetical protein
MRNSDSISLPHPVLGISNDIEGSFSVELSCSIKDSVLNIVEDKLEIENDYFNKLIKENKAVVVYKITCNSTLYMKQVEGVLNETISCSLLSNLIDVDLLIIAKEDIPKFSDSSFHEDTKLGKNKGVFNVSKGAVIGDAGTTRIPLSFDYKKGLSGMIEFEEADPNDPISIDPEGSKIVVKFPCSPKSQNMVTTFTSGRKQYVNVFLNLFLIPALTEAFRFLIESKRENTYDDKVAEYDWARIIDENMNDPISEGESPFELAQLFLKEMTEKSTGTNGVIPVFNAFNEIY